MSDAAHPVANRFGERAHAFRRGVGRRDVLLFELAVGLEEEKRHLVGEVVLQIGADLLVGALRVAGNPFEVRFGREWAAVLFLRERYRSIESRRSLSRRNPG